MSEHKPVGEYVCVWREISEGVRYADVSNIEIVRCRDCARLKNGWLCGWCCREITDLDGFCAWGERHGG